MIAACTALLAILPQLPTPDPGLDGGVSIGTRAYAERSVGVGPGYRIGVEPGSGRWTFTPALGRGVAAPVHLSFQLLEVGRGSRRRGVEGDAELRTDPRGLALLRSGGWRETVALLDKGAKHTLVLESPPEGTGDLVASFRVEAAGLRQCDAQHGESLRWSSDNGGVFLGRVLGIDAGGRECSGAARLMDDRLELSLPAAFVDGARFPLALDPLIGVVTTQDSGQDDRDGDVAFVSEAERFMSVWTVAYSATDTDTYAQRFDSDGAPVGPVIVLDGLVNPATNDARVSGGASAFGVAWERFDGATEWLEVFGVRASDGAVGATAAIEAGSGIAYAPDLGGAAPNGNLLCAYRGPAGQILGALVRLDAAANASIQPVAGAVSFEVSSGPSDFRPVVSEQLSAVSHRWLVAWERFFSFPAPGDFDVAAVPVSMVGATVGAAALYFETVGSDEIEPACATYSSFDTFVLAAAVEEAPGAGIYDVRARTLSSVTAGTTAGPITGWSTRANVDERAPDVVFNGTSLAAAIQVEDLGVLTPVTRIEVAGLRPFSFAADDPFTQMASSAGGASEPAVASAWAQGSSCFLAFTDDPTGSGATDLRTLGWRPATGAITPLLASACGENRTRALAAYAGNPTFKIELLSGSGSIANLLLISANRLDLPCGTCLIVPDPTSGPVLNLGGTAAPTISTTLAIPTAAAGRTYYLQWLTADGSAGACPELGVTLVPPLELFVD